MKKVTPGLNLRIILDIAYFCILPFFLAFYIARRKYHSSWLERICLGRWSNILAQREETIWLHAVSLGEARLAILIYRSLKQKWPDFKYLLTAITPVGEKFLRNNIEPGDYVAYLPLDFSFFMRHIFSKLNFKMLLILETEIWPNLIIASKRYGVPLVLSNARISKVALRRYKFFRPFFRKILALFDSICLSGEVSEKRFKILGLDERKSFIAGSLKFDLQIPLLKKDSSLEKLSKFLKLNNYLLLIAGSTHAGEDILVLKSYFDILKEFPRLKLLIAPRHFKDLDKIELYIQERGYKKQLFSQGFDSNIERSVFIIDKTGYLPALYNLADLVFIGGSLIPYGGHNVIEPALYKKAILIGPYYYNFEEVLREFLKKDALLVVQEETLETTLKKLLRDETLRLKLGQRAFEVVENNRGALDKTLNVISILLG